MDESIVGLIRDQLNSIHDKIDVIHNDLKEHAKTDADYWKKIDQQEGQITLLKWLGSGISGSAFVAWLYSKFGIH